MENNLTIERVMVRYKKLDDNDLLFRSRRLMDDLFDKVGFGDDLDAHWLNMSWLHADNDHFKCDDYQKARQVLSEIAMNNDCRTTFKLDLLILATLVTCCDYNNNVVTAKVVREVADNVLDDLAMNVVWNRTTLVDMIYKEVRSRLW